jgi:acetyltransferase-like isoleucine patch superfamily enzyme
MAGFQVLDDKIGAPSSASSRSRSSPFLLRLPRLIFHELAAWGNNLITYYPDTNAGLRLRRAYYTWKMKGNLGKNARVAQGATIYFDAPLTIGDNFALGRFSVINPNDSFGVIIGNNVGIGERVYIRAANHDYSDPDRPFFEQGHIARKQTDEYGRDASIIVGDDVWIGAGCCITSGAMIGRGAVIAAGSVVTSSLPDYAIAVGNPVRVIGSRRLISFSKKYHWFP